MKKFFKSFFICLIIIAMVSTTAFAAAPNDSVDLQANRYVLKTTVGIVALGSGRIEVDFSVTAAGKMPDVGAMYVDIYNASGKCVKTYYRTGASPLLQNTDFPIGCRISACRRPADHLSRKQDLQRRPRVFSRCTPGDLHPSLSGL